jgi:RNA polymerase sigma-70 factor (ECF subfamily)
MPYSAASTCTTSFAEEFRPYLNALGRSLLRYPLIGKVDLSGVIQQTFLDAFMAGKGFPQQDSRQQLAWLKTAFRRNLTDTIRQLRAKCRNIDREIPLQAGDPMQATMADLLPSDISTPSGKLSKDEELVLLAMALASLPSDQRRAIEYRYLQRMNIADIAESLQKPKMAVAGLLRRGLENLRKKLRESPE